MESFGAGVTSGGVVGDSLGASVVSGVGSGVAVASSEGAGAGSVGVSVESAGCGVSAGELGVSVSEAAGVSCADCSGGAVPGSSFGASFVGSGVSAAADVCTSGGDSALDMAGEVNCADRASARNTAYIRILFFTQSIPFSVKDYNGFIHFVAISP